MKRPALASARDSGESKASIYLDARREWNERYGSYIAQRDWWRWTAIVSLGVAGVAVSGALWLASQSRIVPYVVEVNKLGDALAVSRVDVSPALNTNLVRAGLARMIFDLRTVTPDAAAGNHFILEGYALTDKLSPAGVYLNEYFDAHDPFKRAKDVTVTVTLNSVLPLPGGKTWRVEWTEDTRDRQGQFESRKYWEATITIKPDSPKADADVIENPYGFKATSISWSERLGAQ